MKLTVPGVIARGAIRLDDRRGFNADVAKFGEGQAIVLAVEDEKTSASRKAYGYYYGVVLKLLAEYSGHSVDDLHAWAKAKFTPKHVALLDGNGQIVDDLVVGSTTTTFDGHEFYEYVEELRRFMLERLQVVTPDPDPEWRAKHRKVA